MSNELAYGSTTYGYTPRNLLGSELNGNGSFSYVYDALGRRTATTTPNGSYTSIYDHSRRLSEESSVGGTAIRHDYVWLGSLPVGQIEDGTGAAYWTVTNHLGAPSLLTNSAAAVAWQADYEPFGRVYDMRTNRIHQPIRLPGQQTVSDVDTADPTGNGLTTLVDNGGRWLHQNLGRYSQPDPLGYGPDHFNRFNYVGNDPVNQVDPDGLRPINFADLAIAGGLVAAGLGPEDPLGDAAAAASLARVLSLPAGATVVVSAEQLIESPALESVTSETSELVGASTCAPEGVGATTNLFRAVTTPELESIQSLNEFSNPAGIEVKYFSTSLEGAQSYASQATSAFGDGPFSFVQTSIPTSSITSEMSVTVDRGIQTVVVPTEQLPGLSTPVILPH
jgi:RHS repeat-associated protein